MCVGTKIDGISRSVTQLPHLATLKEQFEYSSEDTVITKV